MNHFEESAFWDILEDEAIIKIFLDRENERAEKPAIVIFNEYEIGFHKQRKGDKFTLWFGRGIAYFSYKNLWEAIEKANEIIRSNKTRKIIVRVETKKKRMVKELENLVSGN